MDVKVILIGNPLFYYLLFQNDEDFKKLFKVKADFSTIMDRNMGRNNKLPCFYKQILSGGKIIAAG
ncbi:MAG: AAA family ATPase [Candidatus Ratteibacteria bacterium]